MNELRNDNLIRNSQKSSVEQIEFLPEWYRQSGQRRRSYHNQYVLLAVMFTMVLILDSIYVGFLSSAKAEIARNKENAVRAKACSKEYEKLESDVNKLKKRAEILDGIDSKIDIPKVLGELSFLTGQDIVFSGLEFTAEPIPLLKDKENEGKGALMTARFSNSSDVKLLGPIRFKISLNGIGADAERITSFVSDLENSPYFGDVSLLFTRNVLLNVPRASQETKDKRVSRFEINCYLANYREVVQPE